MTTKYTEPDRNKLLAFYKWLANPNTQLQMELVLKQLRDVELLHILADTTNKEALTVAWAEYGRRHSTAKIALTMRTADVIDVDVADVRLATKVGLG